MANKTGQNFVYQKYVKLLEMLFFKHWEKNILKMSCDEKFTLFIPGHYKMPFVKHSKKISIQYLMTNSSNYFYKIFDDKFIQLFMAIH